MSLREINFSRGVFSEQNLGTHKMAAEGFGRAHRAPPCVGVKKVGSFLECYCFDLHKPVGRSVGSRVSDCELGMD